jgi:hypothetical protein
VHKLAACVAGLALAAPARAATLQAFHAAPGREGYLTTHGSTVPPHLTWTAGLMLDFADDLLVAAGDAKLLDSRLTLHAMGTVGLWDRGEVGLVVPFAALQRGSAVDGAAPGDVRLVPKVKLLWRGAPRRGFGLAFVPEVSLPTGDQDKANGEQGVAATPRVAVQGALHRWNGALNVGYRIRESSGGGESEQDDELIFSAALARELPRGFEALAEAYAFLGTAVDAGFNEIALPVEVLLAARYGRLPFGLIAWLGGGMGITRGTGAPDLRIFAGIGYQRHRPPAPKKPPPPPPPPPPEPEPEPDEWELE